MISGLPSSELEKYNISKSDLEPYFPVTESRFFKKNIEVHYLGYYKKWTPQDVTITLLRIRVFNQIQE